MNKVSPTVVIQDYVKSRALPVTRQEIITGTMLNKDQVRKATNEMVLRGKLVTELDEMGVMYYSIPPTTTPEPFIPTVKKRPVDQAWDTLVQEAEQRGFAKGYEAGIQTAQTQAYKDAKLDIIRRLVGVVS